LECAALSHLDGYGMRGGAFVGGAKSVESAYTQSHFTPLMALAPHCESAATHATPVEVGEGGALQISRQMQKSAAQSKLLNPPPSLSDPF